MKELLLICAFGTLGLLGTYLAAFLLGSLSRTLAQIFIHGWNFGHKK